MSYCLIRCGFKVQTRIVMSRLAGTSDNRDHDKTRNSPYRSSHCQNPLCSFLPWPNWRDEQCWLCADCPASFPAAWRRMMGSTFDIILRCHPFFRCWGSLDKHTHSKDAIFLRVRVSKQQVVLRLSIVDPETSLILHSYFFVRWGGENSAQSCELLVKKILVI